MRSKKGISVVVGFVLMLSFAVALGAIVTTWYLKFSEKQSETIVGSAEANAECDRVNMNIGLMNATTQNPAEACSIKILNTGELSIAKVKIEYYPSATIYDPLQVDIIPRSSVNVALPSVEKDFEKLYVTPIILVNEQEVICPKDTVYTQPSGWFSGC
ncbi:hypothetical protein HY501_00020 [Candidatus Woesearchaeota archaeon]|nr:hypothetical protein [Candidatus Woesearchaeota archaeon]